MAKVAVIESGLDSRTENKPKMDEKIDLRKRLKFFGDAHELVKFAASVKPHSQQNSTQYDATQLHMSKSVSPR